MSTKCVWIGVNTVTITSLPAIVGPCCGLLCILFLLRRALPLRCITDLVSVFPIFFVFKLDFMVSSQVFYSWILPLLCALMKIQISSSETAQSWPSFPLCVSPRLLTPLCCCCCCQVTSVMLDSVWPLRQQPTRLPHPWDSPGKNTGVGCHFLLQCMKVKSESEVTQSCLTLSNPMVCSLPGSFLRGIFQARVLEWVAIAFSTKEWIQIQKQQMFVWKNQGKIKICNLVPNNENKDYMVREGEP